jgi:hypothetical protein
LKKYWLDVVFLIVFVGVLRLLRNLRLVRSATAILGEEAGMMQISSLSIMDSPTLVGKIGKIGVYSTCGQNSTILQSIQTAQNP